ncbi:MAG: cation-transporting P-type ATPase [Syntrophobacteraceae bacterium]|jgi:magnesium-transporting ATPase (P-type)|nr:cation-transporting P-type ATPase [Syntrophobacteraceae bacterium]
MSVSASQECLEDQAAGIEAVPASAVYEALSTRPEGLSPEEARERLARCGRNAIAAVRGRSLLARFLANFAHLMAVLLWIAGGVALAARMPQLAVSIWLVNVINGLFSFWQEFKAEKATEAMRRLLPTFARLVRDGAAQRVPAEELVPGDVLLLSEGDRISADARLVEAAELRVDQSTLTGESAHVRRTDEPIRARDLARTEIPNLLFAGTSVISGTGKAVVFATGMETEFGKIAGFTQSLGNDLSPLQREMQRVTQMVTGIALCAGCVFFALAVTLAGVDLAESFIFGMGMIVAFVPEGLLPTVTLSLAMGVQRMAARNALIKRLSAVETLGCTSVICTDKTGTLTQNEMTAREIWVAGRRLTVTGTGYSFEGRILEGGRPQDSPEGSDLRALLVSAVLCNNARLMPPDSERPRWSILGDPTEGALRVLARKAGLDLDLEERGNPRLRELPFESRRKRMSTLHRTGGTGAGGRGGAEAAPGGDKPRPHGKASSREAGAGFKPAPVHRPDPATPGVEPSVVAHVKGAPRELLGLCTRFLRNGTEEDLSETVRAEILAVNDGYARNGLRVLAVARRTMPSEGPPGPGMGSTGMTPEAVERDLAFLGLVAMMDPPRPEVSRAVETCRRAGIRIIMITGDYGLTAESIARRIGILQGDRPAVVTGADLDSMTDEALLQTLQGEVIFARAAPEHKLRIVSALQEMDHVVAVTGDGVNDAPALKKAHIGVAMGLTGTDVAKEAADMILTDDNFAAIVHAIEEGRAVYANIKKFTGYIFTSNTPEAVPFILFALSRGRIPLALNVMHILAVDLGTDLVPALGLGAERPEPGIMDRPPRSLSEHVITPALLARSYLFLGPLQSLAVMAAFYYQYWTHGYWGQWLGLPSEGPLYASATAMALACVVTTQIGNLFAQRTERLSVLRIGLFSNRLLWAGIATELAIIFLIVYAPPLQSMVGTEAFDPENWLFLFAWAPLLLVADEGRKLVLRAWERGRPHGGEP